MSFYGENSSARILPMRTTLLTRLNTNINRNSLIRCPFCSRYGHNVIDCNDVAFMTIWCNLINMKRNIMNDTSISYNDKKDVLCTFIRNNAESSINEKRRLKCYGIRYCNATDEDDYFTWSMKICDKIFNMTNDEEIIILNNENSSDYLEFNENDAVSYLIEADNLIRENSITINRYQERSAIHNDSALRILSLFAQIRMDEMLDEIIINEEITETLEDNHKCSEIECYFDKTKIDNEKYAAEECKICYETKELKTFVTANCGHNFCYCCMKQIINHSIELKCALCRAKIVTLEFRDKEICENF